ncbi:hypothetical protein, partial [Corallococcus praedator]|uniref:hypothetical protein n=1 Tax=Corallococcus praedator TaxID=2316724 RepID=UPI001ABFA49A
LDVVQVGLGEVIADDADHIDGAEEAGADGGVTGGAAEEVGVFFDGGFDGIERDGTYDEDGH